MTDLKRFLLIVGLLSVAGVVWAFAYERPSLQRSIERPMLAAATPPAHDCDPQPVDRVAPQPVGPLVTSLVLPSGKRVPIPFGHSINAGDKLDYLTEMTCCWRIAEIRFRVWDTYTERLLYVQEVQP